MSQRLALYHCLDYVVSFASREKLVVSLQNMEQLMLKICLYLLFV